MRSLTHRIITAAFVAGACTLTSPMAFGAVPYGLTEQGRLFDSAGSPLNGTVTLTFTIWDAPSGGNALWTETQTVPLAEGYFSAELGEVTPIPTSLWTGGVRYVGIAVGTDAEMTPRESTQSVPYALVAGDAVGAIHPATVSVNGQLVIDAQGNWVGPATGLVGPSGPQGPAGAQGAAGAQGTQGMVGPQGPAGLQGPQGVAGPQGATGSAGTNGTNGAVGATGATGATGSAGTNGTNGATGATGATGSAGANGTNGAPGAVGATGPQGAMGPQGTVGPTGAQGPIGPTGTAGAPGAAGAIGPQGPAGASPFSLSGTTAYYTAGKVGIGTSAPIDRLHVIDTAGAVARFENNGTGNAVVEIQSDQNAQRAVNFLDSTGNATAQIAVTGAVNSTTMAFHTSSSAAGVGGEAMRIDPNGNLGIGTTSPSQRLDVAGSANLQGELSTQGGQVRRDFLTWSTRALGSTTIHIKTTIAQYSEVMYRLVVEGFNYGASDVIYSDATGYPFQDGVLYGQSTHDYAAGATISQYISADNFVVIKLTVISTYYVGFSVSGWFVNPAGNAFNVGGQVFMQNADL